MRQQISSEQNTDAMRAEIAQTRQRMDTTLDRLADRLHPRHILNDILDFWQARRSRQGDGHHFREALQENARKTGDAFVHQIRQNPVPAFLVGAGIAWLIFDRSRSDQEQASSEPPGEFYEPNEGYGVEMTYEEDVPVVGDATEPIGEPGSSKTGQAKEKARQTAGAVRGKMQEGGRRVREGAQHLRERATEGGQRMRARAGQMGHEVQDRMREGYRHTQERVREGYHRTQERLQHAADAHPLATGGAFLGIGLLAGFLLPTSEREDQWLGETSDVMRQRVKEKGEDLVERGKHVAQAAGQAVRSEAERQGLTLEHLKESVQAVGREAKQAAQRTAEEEGIGPESLKQKARAGGETADSEHREESHSGSSI